MSNETEKQNIESFLSSLESKDYAGAKGSFDSLMASKISDAFETKKVELASGMVDKTEQEK